MRAHEQHQSHTAAVITAAGLSSRMGAFKPLMELEGKPLIQWSVNAFYEAGADTICVVLGYKGSEIRVALRDRGILYAENPDFAKTHMLDSVKIGLAALPEHISRVFLTPVDAPLAQPEMLRRMLQCEAALVRPSFGGRAGHPVLLADRLAAELMKYAGPDGLRGFLASHASETAFVETADEGVLLDADTPQQFERLKQVCGDRKRYR